MISDIAIFSKPYVLTNVGCTCSWHIPWLVVEVNTQGFSVLAKDI